jgi:hypothetical protein
MRPVIEFFRVDGLGTVTARIHLSALLPDLHVSGKALVNHARWLGHLHPETLADYDSLREAWRLSTSRCRETYWDGFRILTPQEVQDQFHLPYPSPEEP